MREAKDVHCCVSEFWVDITVSIVLILFGGLTSGLSLGLLSHSKVDLEVLIKAGLPKDQKNAAKVLPIVKNDCFVLCTLLIAKSLATEALPIFLDRTLPFWVAILVSVIFVVTFVEVLPQAVCTRHGLSFGAKFTLFVQFLFVALAPIAYPISKVLDWLLGKNHSPIFRRAELKTLVDLHGAKAGKGGDLTDDETTIISGALGMTERFAEDAMTPLSRTFSLDINSKLGIKTMKMIASKGHSRGPIYFDNPANIIGLILVKNLIFYHPEDETPIKNLTIRRILRVHDKWPLYHVLKLFQEGHGHMAVVVRSEINNNPATKETRSTCDLHHVIAVHSELENTSKALNKWIKGNEIISTEELESLRSEITNEHVVGIITMEDVLEELLQEEIRVETDNHVEIHEKIRVKFPPSRTSSSMSSAEVSSIHKFQRWRTTSSSSRYHTPVIYSPTPSYNASPLLQQCLMQSASSEERILSSSRSLGAVNSSPHG